VTTDSPSLPASTSAPAPAVAVVPTSEGESDVQLSAVEVAAPAPFRLDPAAWSAAPSRTTSVAPPAVNALSAIVLDEASGQVLFEADPYREMPPASLTKIATAILVLREGNLDRETISDVDGYLMRGSTTMGLYAGDRLTRRDLLYGLMLQSGNDAALVLGRSIAGTDEAFVARMNELVRSLGLKHTSFANPHGLGRVGYSSAYDLAILARYAMQYPDFRQAVSSITWEVTGSRNYAVHNINSFLFNYDGADGVKTGYTNGAGRTIVASATRDGHRLYAVLLNDQALYTDAIKLLDWAFENHKWSSAP
jgi:D-alanyl-D-alanine carboxypeptidase (penicillin-binding protein 5/6)